MRIALHRKAELNGTSSTTVTGSPGRWAARAALVRFPAPALRAIDPSAVATASAVPADGCHLDYGKSTGSQRAGLISADDVDVA